VVVVFVGVCVVVSCADRPWVVGAFVVGAFVVVGAPCVVVVWGTGA